jgi:hypothetical protein
MSVNSNLGGIEMALKKEIYLRETMAPTIVRLLNFCLSLRSESPRERDNALKGLVYEYSCFFSSGKVALIGLVNEIVFPYIDTAYKREISYLLEDLSIRNNNKDEVDFLINLANTFNPKISF